MTKLSGRCACCGCELSSYEVFSAKLRRLRKPVCLGCALDAVVFLRDHLKPMCDKALEMLREQKRGDEHELS